MSRHLQAKPCMTRWTVGAKPTTRKKARRERDRGSMAELASLGVEIQRRPFGKNRQRNLVGTSRHKVSE